MQIDWLTVAAQIANFLVLIWLLQKFLYAPITRAMARREQRIEDRLADARTARQEAEAEAEKLREKQAEIEAAREAKMDEARRQARELRDRLEQEVRAEIEEEREGWLERVEQDRAEILGDLQKRVASQVLQVVRRILSDFADSDLAGQVAREFIRRLEAVGDEDRDRLNEAARRSEDGAVVESGMELDPSMRSRITRAIHEELSERIEVEYRTDPDLLVGIRLTLGDHTVEWSARRYLDRLDRAIRESLEQAGEEPARAPG